jgi:type II secretory pathway pseudopilin PulG
MKKLKAFTIVELIIVLIISGIVISMSFWGIMIFNKYGINLSLNYSKQQESLQTTAFLKEQYTDAVECSYDPSRNELVILDANYDSVSIINHNDSLYLNNEGEDGLVRMMEQASKITWINDTLTLQTEEGSISFTKQAPVSSQINNLIEKE